MRAKIKVVKTTKTRIIVIKMILANKTKIKKNMHSKVKMARMSITTKGVIMRSCMATTIAMLIFLFIGVVI